MSQLTTLENEINAEVAKAEECFYTIGVKLKEIRDNELWKDVGCKSFREYCDSDRVHVGFEQSRRNIRCVETLKHLPSLTTSNSMNKTTSSEGAKGWKMRHVDELSHKELTPRRKHALGEKIAKEVQETGKLPAYRTVNAMVTDELGLKRRKLTKKLEKQEAERKAADAYGENSPAKVLAKMWVECNLWFTSLAKVPETFWEDAEFESPGQAVELAQQLEELASFLRS